MDTSGDTAGPKSHDHQDGRTRGEHDDQSSTSADCLALVTLDPVFGLRFSLAG